MCETCHERDKTWGAGLCAASTYEGTWYYCCPDCTPGAAHALPGTMRAGVDCSSITWFMHSTAPELRNYVHVNAYAVDRLYGGAEEGGWWYDSGRPLGSIMVRDEDDAVDAAKALLRERFGPEFDGNRERHSVIGEENLEIYVEDAVAAYFPDVRPHYE